MSGETVVSAFNTRSANVHLRLLFFQARDQQVNNEKQKTVLLVLGVKIENCLLLMKNENHLLMKNDKQIMFIFSSFACQSVAGGKRGGLPQKFAYVFY